MTLEDEIKQQIKANPIILYMKGTPEMPQCGFSARVVTILHHYNVPYASINILARQDIRAALPKMMNWPTFPQLYVQEELIGGCDIVSDLHETGELQALLARSGHG